MVILKVGERKIGENFPSFIIAEAGVNHNGKLSFAYKLIQSAKECGADAIKFQTFKTESLVLKEAPQAEYQKRSVKGKSQFEMLKELELSFSDFEKIKERCDKVGITFLSTPFDVESAMFLGKLDVDAFKIGSGDFNNILLVEEVIKFGKPVILSTGMADENEVKKVVSFLRNKEFNDFALLHCVSSYPAPYDEINLKAMEVLKKYCPIVGFSDHTKGIHIPVAAVAMGAKIVEKHFTLDRRLKGPDHKSSLVPKEFKEMVKQIREVESATGNGRKELEQSERNTKEVARKSIVALRKIKRGEKIKRELVTAKRPSGGIDPIDLEKLLNKRAKVDIDSDTIIRWDMIE